MSGTTTDGLMEAILASPDDDAPRLVWADREGGERGELVVIQCRLARHDVPREERQRLAAREAELLDENASAWAGYPNARFVRGFVEGLGIPLAELVPNVEAIFARLPRLRDLRIMPLCATSDPLKGDDAGAIWTAAAADLRGVLRRLPPDRLRAFGTEAIVDEMPGVYDSGQTHRHDQELLEVLATSPSLASMRELLLASSAIEEHHIPLLARLRLERLVLGGHRLKAAGLVRLLREAPTIERLVATYGTLRGTELATFLACPDVARLKELSISDNRIGTDGLQQIGACRALSNLERLAVGWVNPTDLHFLAKSPYLSNLRELDLTLTRGVAAHLEGATFTRTLRVLHANDTDAEALYAMFPALERVVAPAKAKK